MDDRERILEAISDLGGTLETVSVAPPRMDDDLWKGFEQRLLELGGRLVDRDEVQALASKPCFVESKAEQVVGFASSVEAIWDAEVGVSLADWAVAQTGSLMVSAGPGKRRLSSLAPPINVVIIDRRHIIATLAEAMGELGDRTTAFITGPSRTADIEGVLVNGVHGPRELLVYVVDGA